MWLSTLMSYCSQPEKPMPKYTLTLVLMRSSLVLVISLHLMRSQLVLDCLRHLLTPRELSSFIRLAREKLYSIRDNSSLQPLRCLGRTPSSSRHSSPKRQGFQNQLVSLPCAYLPNFSASSKSSFHPPKRVLLEKMPLFSATTPSQRLLQMFNEEST